MLLFSQYKTVLDKKTKGWQWEQNFYKTVQKNIFNASGYSFTTEIYSPQICAHIFCLYLINGDDIFTLSPMRTAHEKSFNNEDICIAVCV